MDHFPVVDLSRTGQKIHQLRVGSGLSVKQLQSAFGFSTPQAIYKWQRGDTMPTIDNLLVLSDLFGVPIDDILVRRD
ncbi:MAG: helix-turn-helix transcriptional regulator [Firmicutes bacterium]|nr:helix-turn-helix transcriptional regulator [Bacillota bacterium]